MTEHIILDDRCDVLITNASLVNPNGGISFDTNILIENGKIKKLSKSISDTNAGKKINVNGKYVLPGLIDPHVHYGVYTPINRAATTESKSASIGGVTTIIRMLRLNHSYRDVESHLQASDGTHYVDYAIHASIFNLGQLADVKFLKKRGIKSLKLYLNLGFDHNVISMDQDPGSSFINNEKVNVSPELMTATLKKAAQSSLIVLVHAEDASICSQRITEAKERVKNEDSEIKPLQTWSNCRPPASEAKTISSSCHYAREYGCRIYFVHLGSQLALQTAAIQKARSIGQTFVETCPHYLTHSIDYDNILGKVVPPLRTRKDVEYTWRALTNGIIDTIGSDHVANTSSLKKGNGDLWSSLSGFPGVATLLPVLLSKGVNENRINLVKVAEVTSYNTARIFGMYPRKGIIEEGSDADLVVVDLSMRKRVTPEILQSQSDYTIYDGWVLQGWPIMTMVRGKVIMEQGEVNESTLGYGKFVEMR
jgi:dihydropyrimidinase